MFFRLSADEIRIIEERRRQELKVELALQRGLRQMSGWLLEAVRKVRLSDGRVIVVERYEEAVVRQPIADAGDAFLTGTTLKFVAPPGLATLPVLSTQYRPLILDFDPAIRTWFVIAFDERACSDRIRKRERGEMDATGRINLRPNFEYRLVGGKWHDR